MQNKITRYTFVIHRLRAHVLPGLNSFILFIHHILCVCEFCCTQMVSQELNQGQWLRELGGVEMVSDLYGTVTAILDAGRPERPQQCSR